MLKTSFHYIRKWSHFFNGVVEVSFKMSLTFYSVLLRFDTDCDGAVSSKEVGQIMRAIGQNPSEAEIQVNQID